MTTGLDLLAEGGTIHLTDGTSVPLRYSFRALALLEARFGSVAAVQDAIDATGKRPAFGPLLQMVGAGCVGPGGFEPLVREYQDAKGERRVQDIVYRRRTDGTDLADLLHPGRLTEYISAFSAALGKALEDQARDGQGNGQAGTPTTTVSPGPSATTSPSVPSTFLPTSSGA